MKNKIFFFSFLGIWAILVILNFVKPTREFSEQENRMLAKIPKFTLEKLVDGTYAQGLDKYVNDHFVFRDEWMRIKAVTDIASLSDEINDVYLGKDGYLFEKFEYGSKQKDNVLFISSKVNELAKNIDIPTYFMLVPNSIYINKEKLPNNLEVFDQSLIITDMYNNMPNVKVVNVVDSLRKNKDKYLYFKTDHHMTSYGAYLTYLDFCNIANTEAIKLKNMKELVVSNNFLGTFDSKVNSPFVIKDKISIYTNENNTNLESVEYDTITTKSIYNNEYLSKKDKYSFFLNGNNAKVVVKTKLKNNKKLLVVKDSYAHIMAQFLCNNYEEIHFIDPRYYKASLSEYIEANQITELLFIYNVSNIVDDLGLRNIK